MNSLPKQRAEALKKAIRLQWISIAVVIVTVAIVGVVAGQSQAMKAAWVEDLLALVPPIAFLVAAHVSKRPPSEKFPYGFHRAVGIAHLVAGFTLLAMGGLLAYESVSGLVTQEKPPIGLTVVAGHAVWAGWPMIVVMLLSIAPPMILGRLKMKLAEQLHDKVLYADADMNKADWTTGLGTAIGIFGVGFGLWWMDAAVATLVSLSIIKDGVTNVKAAVSDLMDTRVTTFDEKVPALLHEVDRRIQELDWVAASNTRIRDQGHVFHSETFVVPRSEPTLQQLNDARSMLTDLDWKMHDVVIVPVRALPEY
ncbi:cation diffusion facilitator family transporter [Corynebacterium epidermidicanis]|uniref:Cation diffusion facilitator family transporter n=1 Tax=Corynebacterium epidermidicanis TaxID=1050174 RepID=A0A0G3GUR7_9CORY|nr:cation diffusion facilitator family transporter [Corynebacterium epidermidicanis]AKK04250.1 cation diffusion facilitator family transporter [Corynebacterium epidermidicanis]